MPFRENLPATTTTTTEITMTTKTTKTKKTKIRKTKKTPMKITKTKTKALDSRILNTKFCHL